MRTYFKNCCLPNNFGTVINHNCNMNFSPTSIFGSVGNFGCGFGNSFGSGFGFGLGLGMGVGFGASLGGFFGGMFNNFSFNNIFSGGAMPFGGGFFPAMSSWGFSNNFMSSFMSNSASNYDDYSNIDSFRSSSRRRSSSEESYSSRTRRRDRDDYSYTRRSRVTSEESSEEIKSSQSNPSSKVKDTPIVQTTPEIVVESKNNLAEVPKEILDEMEYIANDAMKKYMKNGDLKVEDILIERVQAEITNIDISGIYRFKKGTKNDYRKENGDIVRTADGTVLTLTFEYNNKEYEIQLKNKKVPKKAEPQTFTQNRIIGTIERGNNNVME